MTGGRLLKFKNTTGGEQVDAAGGEWIETFDPFTGDVEAAVQAAQAAFMSGPWAQMKRTQRGKLLRRFAAISFADKVANPFILR